MGISGGPCEKKEELNRVLEPRIICVPVNPNFVHVPLSRFGARELILGKRLNARKSLGTF